MHKKAYFASLLAAFAVAGPGFAADNPPVAPVAAAAPANAPAPAAPAARRCTSIVSDDQPTYVTLGKSAVIPLKSRVTRILVGGSGKAAAGGGAPQAAGGGSDGVADLEVSLLSPTDLFFKGRTAGSMNVVLQNAEGTCFIKDIVVTVDSSALQAKLAELMPEERGIKVRGAERSIVLTGEVSDPMKLDNVMHLAASYGGDGKKVVNLLRVMTPQQVMLEVKIAEVSKTLLDRLGSQIALRRITNGGANQYSLISSFLSNGGGLVEALRVGRTAVNLDGQKDDGLVRVLAEPNIMAISGQQASFLSGGKIFIPVSQTQSGGLPTITLEEKEFGIGVKFTPTVLDGSRVHLKMVSEVSDLSQTGSPFTTVGGVTAVLPSLTVRRADTTVQLHDGQSLVIAGLIKNNVTETIKRFPGLGEVPVVGALARSSEFQNDQTELLFVITPRMVKPLTESPRLPTDNHVVPSRAEVIFNGALESSTPAPVAPLSETK
ncbi:pilus assembly protein CpaC [Variovorax sp. CF079]|uniref:type II and III secretion system protein family protein n=1 Tax=Variovorax sp. CF079 TaxID=1882774 RepID=UPI000887F209|nr:type II and III secretion system protein family protein [Variovorax sp. CF079]SDD14876.1 pilus assembly protein CpaC [Variovorax sp. CF079]